MYRVEGNLAVVEAPPYSGPEAFVAPAPLQLAAVDGQLVESYVQFLDHQQIPPEPEISEVYGRSLGVMRDAGRVALLGGEVLQKPEVLRLKDEFDTAFGEMLKTADGLGEYVSIVREDSFHVKDGLVRTRDDSPVQDLIQTGADCSRKIGQTDDVRMHMQADRDEADLKLLIDFVQPMFNGAEHNTVIAFSAFPEDMVQAYGEKFVSGLGYNTKYECAMGQLYNAADESSLKTKIVSVDSSNVDELAKKLRSRGVKVPVGVRPSELINFPLFGTMSYEEACELLDGFVVDYEADRGLPPKLATTQQIMKEQSELRDRTFRELYLPTAVSLEKGAKTPQVADFVDQIQSAATDMDEDNAQSIRALAAQDEFQDEHVRVVHGAILYSVANSVRAAVVSRQKSKSTPDKVKVTDLLAPITVTVNQHQLIHQMAASFNDGVADGIILGGCGAEFGYGRNNNPQDTFGGKMNSIKDKNKDKNDAGDGLGPRDFECTNGHPNRRPFGGYVEECSVCVREGKDGKASVGCK